ncbi:MAG: hypothetical protein ACLPXM_15280 [Terriglobales bacterium]
MNDRYHEKQLRAEEIYQQKYGDRLQTECPDKIVAIEITSERAFVADGVVEVLQQALNAGVEEPLFVRRIGSSDDFVAFHPSLTQDRLQAFLGDGVPAYTLGLSGSAAAFPGLMRKLDNDRMAIMLFSTQEGANAFLKKLRSPDHRVIEVSLSDVRDFVHDQQARGQNLVIEMLP